MSIFKNTIGESIESISNKIAKTKFANYAKTNLIQSNDEIMEYARRSLVKRENPLNYVDSLDITKMTNMKQSKEFLSEVGSLIEAVKGKDFEASKDIASEISKNFGNSSYLEYLKAAEGKSNAAKDYIQNHMGEEVSHLYADNVNLFKTVKKFTTPEQQMGIKKMKLHADAFTKGYFASGDIKVNQRRMATVGGTYMGVSTARRFSSGGNLTTNARGERDIVGVPII